MDKKVNLLIIGAQKAGTTSLYEYLKQSPDIYFSEVKEINYFRKDHLYNKGIKYYHSFFKNYNMEKIIASADVHLLSCTKCPARVYEYNPDIKLIAVLRDPMERAYSAYNFAVKKGWESENKSFEKAIQYEMEHGDLNDINLMYLYNGLYAKHLANWLKYFKKESIFLIRDRDLKFNANEVLQKIFNFLNVNDYSENIDTSIKHNKASTVKSKFIQNYIINNDDLHKVAGYLLPQGLKVYIRGKVLKKLRIWNEVEMKYPPLDEKFKEKYYKFFEDDLKELKEKFNIDLSNDE